ncbi:MAG: lyase family protein, partial [archaeon]
MEKQVWKTQSEKEIDPTILEYLSSEDLELDKNLIEKDIKVNKAHAKMLATVGLISWKEYEEIKKKLAEIPKNFELKEELEDVHMNIEAVLGKVGEKLHTAKSRNDQVMTDLHLYMKDKLDETKQSMKEIQDALSEKAGQYFGVQMPAYTHMRPAMPINFETWIGAYKQLLENDSQLIDFVKKQVDVCPLGACAVAGTKLQIDKEFTAKELGFSKSFDNPLAMISSRGEIETFCLYALSSIMLHLNKLANDLQLYSTFEYGIIALDDSVCTSSSMLPQKKNADPLE